MSSGSFSVRITRSIILVKTRILFNAALSKGTWGAVGLGAAFLLVFLSTYYMAGDVQEFVSQALVFAPEFFNWFLAMLLMYLIVFVWISDMIMGHTLNLAQITSDYRFLASLPVPPLSLLVTRLYERTVTNYASLALLLSCLLGIAFRNGFGIKPLIITAVVYLQIELFIGLGMTLLTIVLRRVAKTSTVNNIFSMLNYMSVFVFFLPYLYARNDPAAAIEEVSQLFTRHSKIFQTILAPFKHVADALLTAEFEPVGRLTVLWLIAMSVGAVLFLLFERLQWLDYTHPGQKYSSVASSWRFRGIFRKELLLVKNDLNILTNAVLLPLTMLFAQIYLMEGSFEVNTPGRVMGAMTLSMIYFCMFGPVNAIGSEGKAITILDSLPISPFKIIRDKSIFWSLIMLLAFVPVGIGTSLYLGFSASFALILVLRILVLTPALVWVGVCISAIFPVFDAKVLQQCSTLTGKGLGFMALIFLVPTNTVSFDTAATIILFALLAWSIHYKACEALRMRLDTTADPEGGFKPHDALLVIISVLCLQSVINRILSIVSELEGIEWIVSYVVSMLILGKATWTYAARRFERPSKALLISTPKFNHVLISVVAACFAALASLGWLKWLEHTGIPVFRHSLELWSSAGHTLGEFWSSFVLIFTLCIVAPIFEEIFFRGFLHQSLHSIGWIGAGGVVISSIFFAVIHPPLSIPTAFVLGVCCTLIFTRFKSLTPAILLHAFYNAAILLIHWYHW